MINPEFRQIGFGDMMIPDKKLLLDNLIITPLSPDNLQHIRVRVVYRRVVAIILKEEIEPLLTIISISIPTQEIIGILVLNTSSILKISNGMDITGNPRHTHSKIWCSKIGTKIRAMHLTMKGTSQKVILEGVLGRGRVRACRLIRPLRLMGGGVVKVMSPPMRPLEMKDKMAQGRLGW